MNDHSSYSALSRSALAARLRVLRVDGNEEGDLSWQRTTCHVHRDDLSWAAIPLIHAITALSFEDARPREASAIDFIEDDAWTFGDLVSHLRFEDAAIVLDTDYVRGRMVKTRIEIASNGRLTIDTRNRYLMTERWLGILNGKRNIQVVPS